MCLRPWFARKREQDVEQALTPRKRAKAHLGGAPDGKSSLVSTGMIEIELIADSERACCRVLVTRWSYWTGPVL